MNKKLLLLCALLLLLAAGGCEFPRQELAFSLSSQRVSYDYLTAYFTVTNTGNIHIDYYKVDYTVHFSDGSRINGWTNGLDVGVGKTYNDSFMERIGSKTVSRISFDSYETTVY